MSGIAKRLAGVVPGLGVLTFDPNPGTILLTSGTGVLGYRVGISLLDFGHRTVRAGTWSGGGARDEKAAEVLRSKGAEIVDFDWSKVDEYESVLAGVKTVFCTMPYLENTVEKFHAFLKACKKARVEHFIKISFAGAGDVDGPYRKLPFPKAHGDCDDLLENAPVNYNMSFTIIAASHLMSNPLVFWPDSLRNEQKFYGASFGMGINYVSPNDVAEVATQALLDRRRYKNKKFTITGGIAVTDEEVAEKFSAFFGKTIEFVSQNLPEYEENLKTLGKPNWMIQDMVGLEKIKASGLEEKETSFTDHFEKLRGRPPETYDEYLNNRATMTFSLESEEEGTSEGHTTEVS